MEGREAAAYTVRKAGNLRRIRYEGQGSCGVYGTNGREAAAYTVQRAGKLRRMLNSVRGEIMWEN